MAIVTVKTVDATTFEVSIQAATSTSHIVTASTDYVAKLTGGQMPPEHLIKRSFEFLLEREPNTSILRRFDLSVIARYFPEYERIIRDML